VGKAYADGVAKRADVRVAPPAVSAKRGDALAVEPAATHVAEDRAAVATRVAAAKAVAPARPAGADRRRVSSRYHTPYISSAC
jgi:hypothetical protein